MQFIDISIIMSPELIMILVNHIEHEFELSLMSPELPNPAVIVAVLSITS